MLWVDNFGPLLGEEIRAHPENNSKQHPDISRTKLYGVNFA